MDYSQNPYQTPPQPKGTGNSTIYMLFGLCALFLFGLLIFGLSSFLEYSSRKSTVASRKAEPVHAKVLSTAPDGWLSYEFEDLNLKMELPARVSIRSHSEDATELGPDDEGYRCNGEAVFVMISRYVFDERYIYTAKLTKDYDVDYHRSWSDKGTVSTDFSVSEIAGIPAYRSAHTYDVDGEKYSCNAYYLVGTDWLMIIDIGYPEADRKVGKEEEQRIMKSMKFGELEGLVRKL